MCVWGGEEVGTVVRITGGRNSKSSLDPALLGTCGCRELGVGWGEPEEGTGEQFNFVYKSLCKQLPTNSGRDSHPLPVEDATGKAAAAQG